MPDKKTRRIYNVLIVNNRPYSPEVIIDLITEGSGLEYKFDKSDLERAPERLADKPALVISALGHKEEYVPFIENAHNSGCPVVIITGGQQRAGAELVKQGIAEACIYIPYEIRRIPSTVEGVLRKHYSE